MATQFKSEEVLAQMKGNRTLSNLDQVEEGLGVIAGPLAHWWCATLLRRWAQISPTRKQKQLENF